MSFFEPSLRGAIEAKVGASELINNLLRLSACLLIGLGVSIPIGALRPRCSSSKTGDYVTPIYLRSWAGGRRNQGEIDARISEVLYRRPVGRPASTEDDGRHQPGHTSSGRPHLLGSAADVDKAVKAAAEGVRDLSQTSREERIELLERILAEYQKRCGDIAKAITEEMGAPASLAQRAQAAMGSATSPTAIEVLKNFKFEEDRGPTRIVKEPIGVCGLITPWNWPINQIACKVAPALATGCTMVLKPSEIAPFSGYIFAEILDAAGVPAGVFNLVNGDGPASARADPAHPRHRHGVVHRLDPRRHRGGQGNAAPTVKRVRQELGGKSPNIILEDADLKSRGRQRRRRVHEQLRPVLQRADPHAGAARSKMDEAIDIAKARGRGDHRRRPATATPRWARSSPKRNGTRSSA